MQRRGRPCHTETRSEIPGVGIVIGRSFGAEAAAVRDIHDRRAVQNFVHDRIVLIPQSEIEGQCRTYPEIVLGVALKKRPAVPDHSFALKV